MYSSSRWGIWSTLLLIVPLWSLVSYLSVKQHYALPTPVGPVASNDPTLSEFNILDTVTKLASEIGFRTVGTREHAEGDAWLFEQVLQFQKSCQELVARTPGGRNLECEVWRQQGNGQHRFDMMGYRLYKTYVNLSNMIVRISNGTQAGKEHAILINSHLDSTPPSPGAADDALAVGVMLECLRVLLHTPEWEPKHAIIFLFNNAEESLQDGSHLYSTQHHTANTVRAAINLEGIIFHLSISLSAFLNKVYQAAGSKGPELLFQATSEEMVEAFGKVPYPYGTIIASDIFGSGMILSDTDFRQFEQYLNVSGIDMAVVGHSYFYHTQKDTVENIEPGVAQHMAENTLALLRHFADSESVLPRLSSVVPHKPQITYHSFLGKWFFSYPFSVSRVLYTTLWLASVTIIFLSSDSSSLTQFAINQIRGLGLVLVSTLAPLLGANVVALIMTRVLHRSLSWFSNETLPLVLYGPPSIAAIFISRVLLSSAREDNESSMFGSILLWNSTLAFVLQVVFDFGSSAVFAFPALSFFMALFFQKAFGGDAKHPILLGSHIIGSLPPLIMGTELWCGVGDVFVPLTGRIGEKAPAEFIIASIVGFTMSYTFPLLPAFVHRFPRKFIIKSVIALCVLSVVNIIYMSRREPFDDYHPKRVFIIHSENITTGEFYLNLAAADGSPKFDLLVTDLADEFGHKHPEGAFQLNPVIMNDWNGDWDTLYPFSFFLTPYRMQLTTASRRHPDEHTFKVSAINDITDLSAGTRSFTLQIEHPGIIWTVIAFDAHVLKWSLDDNPPDDFARHHVKEASFYGTDVWYLDLVTKIPLEEGTNDGKLKVNFIGTKENVQWPAKKGKFIEHEDDRQDLALLESIHTWIKHNTGDSVDAMLFGTLGGIAYV